MCVAIPMRVRAVDGFEARCERSAAAAGGLCGPCTPAFDWNVSAQEGVLSCVNVTLAMLDEPGAVHPGDWLLVFRDEAIRRHLKQPRPSWLATFRTKTFVRALPTWSTANRPCPNT